MPARAARDAPRAAVPALSARMASVLLAARVAANKLMVQRGGGGAEKACPRPLSLLD